MTCILQLLTDLPIITAVKANICMAFTDADIKAKVHGGKSWQSQYKPVKAGKIGKKPQKIDKKL